MNSSVVTSLSKEILSYQFDNTGKYTLAYVKGMSGDKAIHDS